MDVHSTCSHKIICIAPHFFFVAAGAKKKLTKRNAVSSGVARTHHLFEKGGRKL
jgi:hypothetical protein